MTLVNITVQNDDVSFTRQSNVVTSLYTTTGVFVTSGTTDNNGIVTFTLPDDSYDCLFYKQGFSIKQPQRIIVNSTLVNNFKAIGHVRTMPESLDPYLCRISGTILGIDGKPVKDLDLRFDQVPTNIILNNNLVFKDPIQAKSDDKGLFDFTLIKGIVYETSMPGFSMPLKVKTANTPAVRVSDLLFPLPVNLSVNTTTITVPVGATSNLPYSLLYSDSNTGKLYNDWSSVQVNYSTNGIINLSGNDTNLVFTGVVPGVCTLTFERVINPLFIWVNPPAFISPTIIVTVV